MYSNCNNTQPITVTDGLPLMRKAASTPIALICCRVLLLGRPSSPKQDHGDIGAVRTVGDKLLVRLSRSFRRLAVSDLLPSLYSSSACPVDDLARTLLSLSRPLCWGVATPGGIRFPFSLSCRSAIFFRTSSSLADLSPSVSDSGLSSVLGWSPITLIRLSFVSEKR